MLQYAFFRIVMWARGPSSTSSATGRSPYRSRGSRRVPSLRMPRSDMRRRRSASSMTMDSSSSRQRQNAASKVSLVRTPSCGGIQSPYRDLTRSTDGSGRSASTRQTIWTRAPHTRARFAPPLSQSPARCSGSEMPTSPAYPPTIARADLAPRILDGGRPPNARSITILLAAGRR